MNVHFTIQVPKSPELEQLLQRSTAKIERLLIFFQPELVQINGRLVRRSAREGVVCSLNLRLPSGQMAAEQAAGTAQTALRAACEDLVEQLKKHKQRLRGEQSRRRRRHLSARTVGEALPLPMPRRPFADGEAHRQQLGIYIGTHLTELRAFVARQLEVREVLGEIRPSQLDVEEVLDEMIALALDESSDPASLERERWFHLLVIRAIHNLQTEVGDAADEALERPLNAAEWREWQRRQVRGPSEELDLQGASRDLSAPNPEEVTYGHEMLRLLEGALRRLPEQQREDILLFALEGFTVAELAHLTRRPDDVVRRSLEEAHRVLREQYLPGQWAEQFLQRTERELGMVH